MWVLDHKEGWEKYQLQYADDTILTTEGEERLKSLLRRRKEENEKSGLTLFILQMKSLPIKVKIILMVTKWQMGPDPGLAFWSRQPNLIQATCLVRASPLWSSAGTPEWYRAKGISQDTGGVHLTTPSGMEIKLKQHNHCLPASSWDAYNLLTLS